MTNDPTWQPPSEPVTSGPVPSGPVAAGPVASGQPASPWTSPAAAPIAGGASNPWTDGGAPPPPAAPLGWAPPPKPGLFPLRPLDFGTVFGTTFRVLRRNPRPVFGVGVGLTTLVTFLAGAVVTVVTLLGTERIARAAPEDAEAIAIGTGAVVLLSALLTAALSVIVSAILQGVIAIEVASASLGERLTFRQIWARGRGRWGALIGWALLLSGALVAAIVILVAIVIAMVAIGDTAGIVAGVLVGIGGGLGMAVLASWLWIKLAFVSHAIVLERLPLRTAVSRAWALVRGRFWRTFGTLLLMNVVVQTAASVVTAPFSLAAGFAGALVNPTGDLTTDIGFLVGINLVAIALGAVVGAIGAVLLAAAATLLYVDARMRDEGLDLDLQRTVEARAQGLEAPDPYLPARS